MLVVGLFLQLSETIRNSCATGNRLFPENVYLHTKPPVSQEPKRKFQNTTTTIYLNRIIPVVIQQSMTESLYCCQKTRAAQATWTRGVP